MGQLFSVLRSWQCFGAECHSSCMDDCCVVDFARDAEAPGDFHQAPMGYGTGGVAFHRLERLLQIPPPVRRSLRAHSKLPRVSYPPYEHELYLSLSLGSGMALRTCC